MPNMKPSERPLDRIITLRLEARTGTAWTSQSYPTACPYAAGYGCRYHRQPPRTPPRRYYNPPLAAAAAPVVRIDTLK
ncbi:MAG: hypothetical protein OXE42_10375 [Gammaproteobacteria bacterium]|nr:hypothetical protein [Gammaproteobacteria bacterium]